LNKRVVVTGLGVLAANGIGVDEFWRTLLAGESGIGPITLFDASEHRIKIAGEVKDFDLRNIVPFPVKPKRMGRHTQLALAAAWMALDDAGLYSEKGVDFSKKIPLFVGVSTSSLDPLELGVAQLNARGAKSVSPLIVGASQPQGIASVLAETFQIIERVTTISTACAAGCEALGAAYQFLHEGRADIALVGGTDAPLTPMTIGAFGSTGMIPDWNDDPKKASRPFDTKRQGGMIAEGSAFFVVESLEHALARGATPYLEIVGHGSSLDPHGETICLGLHQAMKNALANARMLPSEIDYVCAHAPGDKEIDFYESEAIRECIGKTHPRVPVSSIKGVTGNPLAAAAPLQLVACAMMMKHNQIPPTANCDELDPACSMDVVHGQARRSKINKAIMNVHGMGGTNSSLVIQRVSV
jgi:3-oxoacyl-[acyl-carrier-protein] synthase II